MENVLRWGCVCDACDREGRYHRIADQGRAPAPRRPGPQWVLMVIALTLGVLVALYMRGAL